tara:strand:+ start:260 stop:619 length:360 start_codon:yes stop_codon:yes gene_type:complete
MAFKLGKESRGFKHSGNVKIVSTPLDKGTIAEANNDGTISISPHVKPGSALYKRAIKHEMKHMKDMEEGRAGYGDNWVMWEGKIYIRKNGMIDGPAGRLPEGHPDHPWEKEAIAAEKEK